MRRLTRTPCSHVDALRSLECFAHDLAAGYRTDGREVLPALEALHENPCSKQSGALVGVLRANAARLAQCPVSRRKFFHAARALVAQHQLGFSAA